MAITREEVLHVAKLARLKLTEEETQQYTRQLDAILNFAEQLKALDTENVPPTTHVLDVKNVMREDEVRPSWPREAVLQNAPDQEDGYFRVPDVLE